MQTPTESADRPQSFCTKCRVAVVLPKGLSTEEKRAFAQLRRNDPVQAMRVAETKFGFNPREAKVLVLHITSKPGKCHRCERPLEYEVSRCKCRSTNLDW